ncbi:MAG: FliM/FliN family flagellar motor C-terminal domain-containing protein [Acidobacteriaceae bacterium]|nr:FliM/FliN family flagellar motor C-terminal domain-containing protein [Acidobacteriaceae bacterium]
MSTATHKLVATVPELGTPELLAGAFESNEKWPVLQQLNVSMRVRIPLQRVTLRTLRGLRPGALLCSDWPAAEEVPLYAQEVPLSWCEFAVVDEVMAARLTRLG